MFIRKTKIGNAKNGEVYYTYRLVASQRVGEKVSQKTLLNLGKNFSLPREQWSKLCGRIDQVLTGQLSLLPVEEALEELAQHLAARLVTANAQSYVQTEKVQKTTAYHEVDVNSLQLIRPRSIGIEHACLEAIKEIGLPETLEELGFNGPQRSAVIGSLAGRLAGFGSESSTWKWLKERSGLGELLDFDFEKSSLMRLYRASDQLLLNQVQIEEKLFSRISDLYSLESTITLYDLTNTYFEGNAASNSKAQRGRSKEKRSDCPLLTLGLTLDGSGFVKCSKVFEGNVSEGDTLQTMLEGLNAPPGAMVVMDAGIAKRANTDWLAENNYRYLVVNRERKRCFESNKAVAITSATGNKIEIQREVHTETEEIYLYCHSEKREEKDKGITDRFKKSFEEGLQKISDGLNKPRCTKKRDKVMERIGRLKAKSKGIGQHYQIELEYDENGENVTNLTWQLNIKQESKLSHPGVYCLRTNETEWNEETLWRTYTMLTDLEAVFRSLKSELGLRPNYHHKEERNDGHLFITVLAYQVVHVIRRKLLSNGIHESWTSLRRIFEGQQRVTAVFCQKNGKTLNVRKATVPETRLRKLYEVLGISKFPGGIKKLLK
jgi:hypothetical protein